MKQITGLNNKMNNLLSARGIELEKEDLSSERGLQREKYPTPRLRSIKSENIAREKFTNRMRVSPQRAT